ALRGLSGAHGAHAVDAEHKRRYRFDALPALAVDDHAPGPRPNPQGDATRVPAVQPAPWRACPGTWDIRPLRGTRAPPLVLDRPGSMCLLRCPPPQNPCRAVDSKAPRDY